MFVLWSEAYQIFIKILNFRKTSSNGTGKNLVRRFSPIQLYILWGRGRKELGDYIYIGNQPVRWVNILISTPVFSVQANVLGVTRPSFTKTRL